MQCKGPHQFENITPDKVFGSQWRCKLCGGQVHHTSVVWYRAGLKDGRAEK